jgi:hypothetical protein
MVLAISFVEAPLKFRAPGVTIPVGLGIGRLVFRALNTCEAILAGSILGMFILGDLRTNVVLVVAAAVMALLVQLLLVRPALTRRTNAVLAGHDVPRSRGHLIYVVLEVIKVVALSAGGTLLLMS